MSEAVAQGRAVNGLGWGGDGAGWRGLPGMGTPSSALEERFVPTLGEISSKGHMAPLSMLLHIRLLASRLGGSSGVELARRGSNGDRILGTAPRPAAGPQGASDRGPLFCITIVLFCNEKPYK